MILVFPHHDPKGLYNETFRAQLHTLQREFDAVCMSVTAATLENNAKFLRFLKDKGCIVHTSSPDASLGTQARAALQLALDQMTSTGCIFFGFIDRILFALATDFRDRFISDLGTYRRHECVVFERSETAWKTHPSNYREVEQMVSKVFQLLWHKDLELRVYTKIDQVS